MFSCRSLYDYGAPVALSLVLVLATIYTLVAFFTGWHDSKSDVLAPIRADLLGSKDKSSVNGAAAGTMLAGLHLFGETSRGTPSIPLPKKLPETKLNLTLHGLFTESASNSSAAIIGASGRGQKLYFAGDKLPSGAVVYEIQARGVVLRKNDRYEVLHFPRQKELPLITPPSSTPSTETASYLKRFRDLVRTNPAAALMDVRIVPVGTGTHFSGYRLLPGQNRELYRLLGVTPDDIVTRVNGIQLRGLEVDKQLVARWAVSNQIVADVTRAGKTRIVRLDLR